MKENHFIEQMMVIGSERKFVAALIVPSYINLIPWCTENNVLFYSHAELIKDRRVIALFNGIIAQFNPEFNHVEQVKKVALLANEWSVESGELTPTGKMKCKVIMEKYKDEIDKLYDGETETDPIDPTAK
jgi:long-chain acyl-CoA synthetase